ncbi:hypothetical protein F511_22248 [Dorcoceras hygrometricum]|uniref:Uncharacterized protein n=1 Tax=Dorcoceras hygrometricum TaxID=472368 RepID=A0A2Z7C187_9LAMI|nr:hypothetical protein F511_22248 [Dorcoceras hygrometricum]
MMKWQHRGVWDPEVRSGEPHLRAPGSDQIHRECGTSTVGGGDRNKSDHGKRRRAARHGGARRQGGRRGVEGGAATWRLGFCEVWDTASSGLTTIVTPKSQFRTDPSNHDRKTKIVELKSPAAAMCGGAPLLARTSARDLRASRAREADAGAAARTCAPVAHRNLGCAAGLTRPRIACLTRFVVRRCAMVGRSLCDVLRDLAGHCCNAGRLLRALVL